jgi:pyridoxine 5-phosphate synthase
MKRLTVSIDELATLRYVLHDSDIDPVQYAMLCEVAGVHGITLTLADMQKGIQERDAQFIKRIHKTFMNIRIPTDPQFVKMALSINPDMVTFVDVSKTEPLRITPLPSNIIMEALPDILSDFHANNISVAVYSVPEINSLKHLNRIRIDYVEFDCSEITFASDSNEELVGLDKLNSATIAATKLGMGVNCFGGIDYHYLPSLAAIPRLEDICMGASVLKRSLLVGVNQAVKEALQQVLFHQRGD